MSDEPITSQASGEDPLTSHQAVLLDELTARLVHVQCELGEKNLTIRQQEAGRIIQNHVLAGSAMGLVPLPLFDLVALSGTLHNMLEQLCQHYNVPYDAHKIRTVLIAVLTGSLPTLALSGLGSISKLAPGVGTLGGNTALTLLGGAITYAIGQSFNRHFSRGGTLDDVNTAKLKQVFRQELVKGKRLIQRRNTIGAAA